MISLKFFYFYDRIIKCGWKIEYVLPNITKNKP